MLPLELFKNRVIAVASAGGFIMGTVLFCAAAFVPMYTQGVLGGTAIDAGMTLAPMSIGWPIASTTSGWFLAKRGYRPFILAGAFLAVVGCALLPRRTVGGARPGHAGHVPSGAGTGVPLHSVPLGGPERRSETQPGGRHQLRPVLPNHRGSIAVAALGAILNVHLARDSGERVDPNVALNPALRAGIPRDMLQDLVSALDGGLGGVYLVMTGLAVIGIGHRSPLPGRIGPIHAFPEETQAGPA